MVPAGVLNVFVAAVAAEVAERVLVELDARAPVEQEPWRLLKLEEVVQRLGRSERWVRSRVKRGELTVVRLDGGALAFDLEDVKAFARARRVAVDESGARPSARCAAVSAGDLVAGDRGGVDS